MILDEYAHIIQSLVEEVCNLQMCLVCFNHGDSHLMISAHAVF